MIPPPWGVNPIGASLHLTEDMIERVDPKAWPARLSALPERCVLGFFGEFSEASRRALPLFETWGREHPELPVLLIDVGVIKEAPKRFSVTAVPTVLSVVKGKVERVVVGEQTKAFWSRALLGERTQAEQKALAERGHRVTVYVTNVCPWCTRVKSYLREHHVAFSEVNVERDERAMRDLVARSGQQGVPQVDIDGSIVVGFDKARIDALLGLRAEH